MVNADSLQREKKKKKKRIFNLIPGGLQQVELARWCDLVGIGVKGGGKVFKATLDLQHRCG